MKSHGPAPDTPTTASTRTSTQQLQTHSNYKHTDRPTHTHTRLHAHACNHTPFLIWAWLTHTHCTACSQCRNSAFAVTLPYSLNGAHEIEVRCRLHAAVMVSSTVIYQHFFLALCVLEQNFRRWCLYFLSSTVYPTGKTRVRTVQ